MNFFDKYNFNIFKNHLYLNKFKQIYRLYKQIK